jgi:predicted ATPase/DNA-binding SARP family transcriptional activator
MEFLLLGPLEARAGGRALELGGQKQRAVLALLLLEANRVVSRERLIEALWEDAPPETARKALQVYVSQLRKLLGRDRLVTRPPGYLLSLEDDELDLTRFVKLCESGRQEDALALWRGPPLAELAEYGFAKAEAARLEELRSACVEERLEHDLNAGKAAQLVGELEALVREQPLRERPRELLMLALYRCGRQAEALAAYQDARRVLVDDLGIEPGQRLREMHQRILNQDPDLELPVESRIAGVTLEVPAQLAASLDAEAPESRKVVSVLCARLRVLSVGGDRLDPETLRPLHARVLAQIAATVDRHGGRLLPAAPEAAIALFGVPAMHEDDAGRALHAALEMSRDVEALGAELHERRQVTVEISLGISTGELIVGGSFQPSGEPLTLATRLAQRASPSEVLLDDQTYGLARDIVLTEPSDEAFRLLELVDEPVARRSRFSSPMVGRARELRRLCDAFEQATGDESCQLFSVLGMAGVGKSRLVEEFLQTAAGAQVLRGRCLPYGEGITYWPLLEVVRQTLEVDDLGSLDEAIVKLTAVLVDEPDAELVAMRISGLLGLAESGLAASEGLAAVKTLFQTLARKQPLVLVFDDIHWAEPTFLDLIDHLADQMREASALLVCLARPELIEVRPGWGGGKFNATSILLEPLSEDESGRLIDHLNGDGLDTATRRRIVEAAGGNPLFVEEMLALALDTEQVGGEFLVPPSIQALLAVRLDGLSLDERSLLERAAVVGKVFYEDSLVDLAPEGLREEIPALLESLVRKELVRPDRENLGVRTYHFRHLLIRDAAYDSIPKRRRADLHEGFGHWLDRLAHERRAAYEEVVGYHFEQAHSYLQELGSTEDRVDELAREAAERLGTAGKRAFIRSDAPAGVNLTSRAVALVAADDPQRVELIPNVRVIQGMTDQLAWADKVLTEAVEAAATSGDRQLAARALVQRAFLRLFTEPAVSADELIETAQRATAVFNDCGDELGLARAWRLTAQAHYLGRRAGPCAEASERALVHARRADNMFEQREILEWLAIALWIGPTPAEEGIQRCRQLLKEIRGDRVSEIHLLGAQAYLLAMQGKLDEASALIGDGRRLMDDLGEWIWSYVFHSAAIHVLQGAPEAAEAELLSGYESLKQLGEKSHFSSMAQALAVVRYQLGRWDEAEELTHDCEQASRANDVNSAILWRSTRAKLLARKGEQDQAARLAAEAVALAASSDFHQAHADALRDLAETHEIAGRHAQAPQAINAAIDLYELKGNTIAAKKARAELHTLQTANLAEPAAT